MVLCASLVAVLVMLYFLLGLGVAKMLSRIKGGEYQHNAPVLLASCLVRVLNSQ